MNYDKILTAIIDILNNLLLHIERNVKRSIKESTKIADELDIHSIMLVELSVELEDAFRIKLNAADLVGMATVSDIANLVASKLPQAIARSA